MVSDYTERLLNKLRAKRIIQIRERGASDVGGWFVGGYFELLDENGKFLCTAMSREKAEQFRAELEDE